MSLGAAKPSDFDEHIAALKYYDSIPQTMGSIETRLRAELESVLGKEWCQSWADGLPHYVDVPGQINVMEIARLWTYAKALDLVDGSEIQMIKH